MLKKGLKNTIVCITLGLLIIHPLYSSAQSLATDPEILIAKTPLLNNAGLSLETALVNIKAVDAPAFHTTAQKSGIGSEMRYGQGIIIDPDGVIATNKHVIGNAQHIYVALYNGKIFEAAVLSNSKADLCLIKISVPDTLETISLAAPSEIQVGTNVVAIANATLNPQRVRDGQVIKIFKEVSSNNAEVLEMNISLKPGDSGGPILNEKGSLLGLIMGKQISDPSKSYAIASSRIEQEYSKYINSILN